MRKDTKDRLHLVERETDEHCQTLDNHDQRINTLVETANQLLDRTDSLGNLVRGGAVGPGLAGQVRELTEKVDLLLSFVGAVYVPEETVEPRLEAKPR